MIDLKKYKEDGYIVIENFVKPSDLQDFELYLDNLCMQQIKKLNIKKLATDPIIDLFNRGGQYRSVLYESIQQSAVLKRMELRMFDMLKDQGILNDMGFLSPILRSGLFISLPHQKQLDNPVHQDIYSYISKKYLRFWVAMRKVDEYHGSMKIYPKSHLNGYIHPDDFSDPTYPTFSDQKYSDYNSILLKFKPGPAIMFNPLLMHESVPNLSDEVRFSFAMDIIDISDLGDFNNPDSDFSHMQKITKGRRLARKN